MPNGPYSVFDGYTLTLHRADGSVAGSWPAISGEPGHQKPSEQGKQDVGPLPEGGYSFPLGKIQYLNAPNEIIGAVTALTGIKGGQWPGSIWAWGTQRAFLSPNPSTDTRGRTSFSIHGGFRPGSRGCIDLGPNEDAYFAAVRRLGGTSHDVVVQYAPRLETEDHPLASQSWFDGVHDYLFRPIPGLLTPKEEYFPDRPDGAPPPPRQPSAPRGGQLNDPARFALAGAREADAPSAGPRQLGATPPSGPAPPPPGLPPHVIDNANYLSASGLPVTPRTMYVANYLGPQRAVDFFNRAGSVPPGGIPFPDAATRQQTHAWVQALRGGASAAPAAGFAAPDLAPDDAADAARLSGAPENPVGQDTDAPVRAPAQAFD